MNTRKESGHQWTMSNASFFFGFNSFLGFASTETRQGKLLWLWRWVQETITNRYFIQMNKVWTSEGRQVMSHLQLSSRSGGFARFRKSGIQYPNNWTYLKIIKDPIGLLARHLRWGFFLQFLPDLCSWQFQVRSKSTSHRDSAHLTHETIGHKEVTWTKPTPSETDPVPSPLLTEECPFRHETISGGVDRSRHQWADWPLGSDSLAISSCWLYWLFPNSEKN